VENGTFHARHKLDHSGVTDVLDETVNDFVSEIAVGHLAPAESQAGLDFVPFGEEANGLILLGLVVVLVDGYRELDFLDGDDFLAFASGALAFLFFVEVAAVILNATDGRNSVR